MSDQGIIYQMNIGLTQNAKISRRVIYNFLNFLGDIGGFSGAIFSIFSYIFSLPYAKGLESFLVSQIFRRDGKKFTYPKQICTVKDSVERKIGSARIDYQLDIVNFIRHQV
jgi:hypothetical protein